MLVSMVGCASNPLSSLFAQADRECSAKPTFEKPVELNIKKGVSTEEDYRVALNTRNIENKSLRKDIKRIVNCYEQ